MPAKAGFTLRTVVGSIRQWVTPATAVGLAPVLAYLHT
jgi:hypothetical protein